MAQWKDISSHSQNAKDRTPNTWELRPNGHVRITVHRHITAPDVWHVSCDPWFRQYPLRPTDAEAAKALAVEMVRDRAAALLAELRTPD